MDEFSPKILDLYASIYASIYGIYCFGFSFCSGTFVPVVQLLAPRASPRK